jgi:hypothetical protein
MKKQGARKKGKNNNNATRNKVDGERKKMGGQCVVTHQKKH